MDNISPPVKQSWFDPNWRDFHKLWSIRLTVLMWLFSAAWVIVPVFSSMIPPVWFAMVILFLTFAIGIARLKNQPGIIL